MAFDLNYYKRLFKETHNEYRLLDGENEEKP